MALPTEGILDLIHSEDLAEIKRVIGESVSDCSGKAYRVEYRFKHKEGHYRWLQDQFVVKRDDKNETLARIGCVSDITERRRDEEALRLSESKLRAILTNSHDAIGVHVNGIWAMCNPAALRLFGVASPDELLGTAIINVIAPDYRAQIDNYVRNRIIGANAPSLYLTRGLRKDGVEFDMDVALSAFMLEGKRHVLVILRDITERKQMEAEKEKLEVVNRQLQKSESLARMAAAIAHHFNNQLMTVMMSLDMAKRALSSGVNSLDMVDEAAKAARRAAEVSTLMLSYLGLTHSKKEPLDIVDLCHNYLPFLRASLPDNVMFATDFPSSGLTVMASPNQIHQLLINLVTNAWEALGNENGSIRLAVKIIAAADIPATNRFPVDSQLSGSDYACLEIADTGCGIAARDIEKIFDPFFSTKFVGRGLGLSVVLGTVRAHHGVIAVESNMNHGSVFRFFLPVSQATLPQKSPSAPIPPIVAGYGTILLVEDEKYLRTTVTMALKSMGFIVLEAQDGIEAVDIFRQHQAEIRLVITDLTMPRMGGWETLAVLRKLVPGIPVILASGYSQSQVQAGHHSELPQAFLSKPYEVEALSDAISHVLNPM